jgi:hypothetical protein
VDNGAEGVPREEILQNYAALTDRQKKGSSNYAVIRTFPLSENISQKTNLPTLGFGRMELHTGG